jgi:hypothetical protein
MIIDDFQSSREAERISVSARVRWEESERRPMRVFFATPPLFSDTLTLDPHAFLLAGFVPAMRHGERRLRIEAALCPHLRIGVATAMEWLCAWYPPHDRRLSLEFNGENRMPRPEPVRRTASFLSGGIDSLATLRDNRLHYPTDHPLSIQACVTVHGFDIGSAADTDPRFDYFNLTVESLAGVCMAARCRLIPVYTNVRHLDPDDDLWMLEFHGAALAAVAHALSFKLSDAMIAASDEIIDPVPWGSHPSLDHLYSSTDLRIHHDGVRFTRYQKLKLIAAWEPAVTALRVCTKSPQQHLNCGRCNKCLLALIQLLVVGRLKNNRTFPVTDISAEMLEGLDIKRDYTCLLWEELIAPLEVMGRSDLSRVVRRKTARYRNFAWMYRFELKERVKRLDRRLLRGRLQRLRRTMRNSGLLA